MIGSVDFPGGKGQEKKPENVVPPKVVETPEET
jgi:hypothetical protein